jgi:hypothetical protein
MKSMNLAFSSMWLSLFFGAASISLADDAATPSASETVALREGTDMLFRLTGKLTSKSPLVEPDFELVQDVKVGDVIVIPKGTSARYSLAKRGAGRGLRPGVVDAEFEGIQAINGDEVPLVGGFQMRGEEVTCMEYDCLVLLALLWMKGHAAKIPAESLVSVVVAHDVLFERAALEELTAEVLKERQAALPRSRVRVHFYATRSPASSSKPLRYPMSFGIRIDGKRAGSLRLGEYACVEIEPGVHIVQIAREPYRLRVQPGPDYHVRLSHAVSSFSAFTLTDLTPDYEIHEPFLRRGKLKKQFNSPCFD